MMSFIFSLVWVIAVLPGQTAASAIACGKFLLGGVIGTESQLLSRHPDTFLAQNYEYGARLIAGAFVIIISLSHSFLPLTTIKLQSSLAILKLVVLGLVLVCGVAVAANAIPGVIISSNYANMWSGSVSDPGTIVSNMFTILYIFEGWDTINYSLDEFIDPVKNLPLASFFSIFLCIILVLLCTVAYYAVVPIASIIDKSKGDIALQYFTIILGPIFGQTIISILISLSAFSTVMVLCFISSRISFECAKDGYFHPYLGKLMSKKSKYDSPLYPLLFHCIISLLFIFGAPPGDSYSLLVQITSYPQWIFFGITVSGVLLMRFTKPDLYRPIEAPVPIAIFFVLFSIFMACIPFVPPPAGTWTANFSYLLVPTLGITLLIACWVWWYIQVVIFDGLAQSFHAEYARSHNVDFMNRSMLLDKIKYNDLSEAERLPLLESSRRMKKSVSRSDLKTLQKIRASEQLEHENEHIARKDKDIVPPTPSSTLATGSNTHTSKILATRKSASNLNRNTPASNLNRNISYKDFKDMA